MKYKDSSFLILKDWKKDFVQDLCVNIKRELLDKVLHTKEYIIGKHKMLKNVSLIEHYQILYMDYSPRLS